nr:hypothetical protein [Tanacetum cinerariifolium]
MLPREARHLGLVHFNTESRNASINLNVNVGDDDEDDVQELLRPIGRDKAKDLKKKGARSSGSSANMNDEALARLMVSKLALQTESAMAMKKEERATFLEIKRREVACRERELEIQEQHQENIRFYMQPYNHLTRDALRHMEALRAEIKAKWNLPY